MPSVRKPAVDAVQCFLDRQRSSEFSYAEIGCTRSQSTEPSVQAQFIVDRYRALLGRGEQTFQAACRALRDWRMFSVGWIELDPQTPQIAEGETVAVLIRACGLWWLNAARIVYVDDRQSSPRTFAFAYGTLPSHVERGEERFCVHWAEDDCVWYELTAVSRPGHWYTWIGLPLVRRLQRRFAADSQRAMQRAVGAHSSV